MSKTGRSPIHYYRGTTGLNTKVDASEIPLNYETGISDLPLAINVDISRTGRLSRRSGFAVQRNGESWHSLFSDGDTALGIKSASLYRIARDFTIKGIRSGLTPEARTSYVKVFGEIFYANGHENGVVRGDTSYAWESTQQPTGQVNQTRHLVAPPVGEILGYYGGRIFIGKDKTLWYTEPFAYYHCDLGQNNVPFSERITMVAPVNDGIFVGVGRQTIFLRGRDPLTFEYEEVDDAGPVPGTAARVDSGLLPNGTLPSGLAWAWTSSKGICLGGRGGSYVNLTLKRLDIPAALEGAGVVMGNKYVVTLNP